MKQTELQKVLDEHRVWLDSQGIRGKQARLENAALQQCDLRGADLRYAVLTGARLTRAQLAGADLSFADLRNVELAYADCQQARLDSALVSGASLEGTCLEGASLQHASFNGANLRYARCQNADFSSARVFKTNLNHANLSHARFTAASLEDSDLMQAILTGVQFDGATLISVRAAPGALPEGASGPNVVKRLDPDSPEAKERVMGGTIRRYLLRSVFFLTLPVCLLSILGWLALAIADVGLMAMRARFEAQLGVPYHVLLAVGGAALLLVMGQLAAALLVRKLLPES